MTVNSRKLPQKSIFIAFVVFFLLTAGANLAFAAGGLQEGLLPAPGGVDVGAVITHTFRIPVAADAEVDTHDPDKNQGAEKEMKVLADGAHIHRPLFRYDLSSVLPGSTVTSATAWFYVTEKDENPVTVHRVTTRWEENVVTWNSFAEGFFPVSSGSFIPYPYNQMHSADITALVADWVTGVQRNRGLALIPSVEKRDSKYATQEDDKLERHSYLEVVVDNAAIRAYADDFDPATGYSGSDGGELWTPAWQEIGESNGSGLGLVQVVTDGNCPAGSCLKIGKGFGSLTGFGVSRQIDLSDAVAATLSFSYAREDANALLYVEVSGDGGSNWHRWMRLPWSTATPAMATRAMTSRPTLPRPRKSASSASRPAGAMTRAFSSMMCACLFSIAPPWIRASATKFGMISTGTGLRMGVNQASKAWV